MTLWTLAEGNSPPAAEPGRPSARLYVPVPPIEPERGRGQASREGQARRPKYGRGWRLSKEPAAYGPSGRRALRGTRGWVRPRAESPKPSDGRLARSLGKRVGWRRDEVGVGARRRPPFFIARSGPAEPPFVERRHRRVRSAIDTRTAVGRSRNPAALRHGGDSHAQDPGPADSRDRRRRVRNRSKWRRDPVRRQAHLRRRDHRRSGWR